MFIGLWHQNRLHHPYFFQLRVLLPLGGTPGPHFPRFFDPWTPIFSIFSLFWDPSCSIFSSICILGVLVFLFLLFHCSSIHPSFFLSLVFSYFLPLFLFLSSFSPFLPFFHSSFLPFFLYSFLTSPFLLLSCSFLSWLDCLLLCSCFSYSTFRRSFLLSWF